MTVKGFLLTKLVAQLNCTTHAYVFRFFIRWINPFLPNVPFWSPWKHRKTKGKHWEKKGVDTLLLLKPQVFPNRFENTSWIHRILMFEHYCCSKTQNQQLLRFQISLETHYDISNKSHTLIFLIDSLANYMRTESKNKVLK